MVINAISNERDMTIRLTVGLIRKTFFLKMSQYFREPLKCFGGNINVKALNLSNYATKTDLKNVTHVETPCFAFKKNKLV